MSEAASTLVLFSPDGADATATAALAAAGSSASAPSECPVGMPQAWGSGNCRWAEQKACACCLIHRPQRDWWLLWRKSWVGRVLFDTAVWVGRARLFEVGGKGGSEPGGMGASVGGLGDWRLLARLGRCSCTCTPPSRPAPECGCPMAEAPWVDRCRGSGLAPPSAS